MSTDRQFPTLRMKPSVTVAVAVSSCFLSAWIAMMGGSNRRPVPMPARVSKIAISPTDEVGERWRYKPFPKARSATPVQISSIYRPV